MKKCGAAMILLVVVLVSMSGPAAALPSFAPQTGMPCSACHTTAFGPSLTPEGEAFKLLGYSLDDAASAPRPWNALAIASFTHIGDAVPGGTAAPGFEDNDNAALDEIDLVYAGPLAPNIGALAEVRYDGVAHEARWGNVDLRYADDGKPGGADYMLWGVSLNNNPTVQDLWNTSPAWSLPFVRSDLAPQPAAAPVIEERLAHEVYGLSGYVLWADHLYLEVGAYRSLPGDVRDAVGVVDYDRIDGFATYSRIAAIVQDGDQALRFGAFGMRTPLYPANDTSAGHDHYDDFTYDATYSRRAGSTHLKVQAAYTVEVQELDASAALGRSANERNRLRKYHVTGLLSLHDALTLTGSAFVIEGSPDAGLYSAAPLRGSINGEPDSGGALLDVAYGTAGQAVTDFLLNYRVGLQYTHYDRFNGAHSDYDGFGRDASDNDALFAYLWVAL